MQETNAPAPARSDKTTASSRNDGSLMSFKAFLRMNGGFGATKANERKTD